MNKVELKVAMFLLGIGIIFDLALAFIIFIIL